MRDIVLVEDTALYGRIPILAIHGLSQLLEVDGLNILYDVGSDYRVLLNNAAFMGVNLRDVDIIVLSHGHYDHGNDLHRILQVIGKREIPVIVHREAFSKSSPLSLNTTPEDIEYWGGKLIYIEKPYRIGDNILISGTVPRLEGNPYHPVLDSDGNVVDEVIDDMSIFVDLGDKGIAVFTGCGHSGIVNIVEYARELFGKQNICCVVGGLHGQKQSREVIDRSVEFLRELGAEVLAPMHCSAGIRDGLKGDPSFVGLSAGSVLEL